MSAASRGLQVTEVFSPLPPQSTTITLHAYQSQCYLPPASCLLLHNIATTTSSSYSVHSSHLLLCSLIPCPPQNYHHATSSSRPPLCSLTPCPSQH
ncbi:hypothetical protein E2C01_048491 [Portunus trituberculatus]|uniref:Uncharacterized protein n=1 Tax=Portunus trituberculatus TaxID=210409 RepID=A0A5B7G3A4_PORTR|nr:hypothetical protein [Portunus trituberculatus]